MKKPKHNGLPSLILKQTKHYIRDRDKYNEFIFNQNDSLLKSQFPYLTSKEILDSTIDNKRLVTISNEPINIEYSNFQRVFRRKRLIHSMAINKIPLPILTSTPLLSNDKDSNSQRSFHSLDWFYKSFRLNKNCEGKSQERYHSDIFESINYSNLEYNENEIYNHKAEIRALIEDKIYYYKNNCNSNQTIKFSKEIKVKNSNFQLGLDSLKVNFIDQETNITIFEFTLPFSLLPVFYYKGIEYFKQLLVNIIKFGPDFEKIYIEEKNIYYFISNRKELKKGLTISGNHSFYSNNLKNISNKINQTKSEIKESEESFNVYDEIYYNEYKFSWSTPKKNYMVQVVLPKIYLKETKMNITLSHYIDYELLFYLYKKNFLFWDFYILKYLFSFKQCRNIFDGVLSKSKEHKIMQNIIELKPKKIKDYNMNSYNMKFITTNEDYENTFNEIQSLKLKVFTREIKNENDLDNNDTSFESVSTEHHIYLNFAQARKIFISIEVMTSDAIKDILLKFCEIKGSKVEFNYKLFNSMPKEFWLTNPSKEYKEKIIFVRKASNMNINIPQKKEKKNSQIKLEIIPPLLLRTKYKEKGSNEQNSTFITGAFQKIMNENMIIWAKYFNKEDNINLPASRRMSLFMRRNSGGIEMPNLSPKRKSPKKK